MHYIPSIENEVNALKDRWNQGTLSQPELRHFYKLLDKIVREARRSRTDMLFRGRSDEAYIYFQKMRKNKEEDSGWVPPMEQYPEEYLLLLLNKRIKNTVHRFLNAHKQYKKEANLELSSKKEAQKESRELEYEKTSAFTEWMGYAQEIVWTIILGDAAERNAREKNVQQYIAEYISSEDKHLTLNNKRIKANVDELLGEIGTHKKENLIAHLSDPERLQQEEKNLKFFSDASKDQIPLDDNRPGFFIRDEEAIEAAQRIARKRGLGYDPDYKRKKLQDLSIRRFEIKVAKEKWRKTKPEMDLGNYLMQQTGYNDTGLKNEFINTRSSQPNLINYLFGDQSPKNKGKLYYRLCELHKYKQRDDKKEKADNFWEQPIKKEGVENLPYQDDFHISVHDTWRDLSGILTDDEYKIFQLRANKISFRKIGEKLGISHTATHKRWKKIEQKIKLHRQ